MVWELNALSGDPACRPDLRSRPRWELELHDGDGERRLFGGRKLESDGAGKIAGRFFFIKALIYIRQ